MKYLTSGMDIPRYMIFPRFLLTLGIGETPVLLYTVLLDRARLSMSKPMWTAEPHLCHVSGRRKSGCHAGGKPAFRGRKSNRESAGKPPF